MSSKKIEAAEVPCPSCGAMNLADYTFCFCCRHVPGAPVEGAKASKRSSAKKTAAKKSSGAKKRSAKK